MPSYLDFKKRAATAAVEQPVSTFIGGVDFLVLVQRVHQSKQKGDTAPPIKYDCIPMEAATVVKRIKKKSTKKGNDTKALMRGEDEAAEDEEPVVVPEKIELEAFGEGITLVKYRGALNVQPGRIYRAKSVVFEPSVWEGVLRFDYHFALMEFEREMSFESFSVPPERRMLNLERDCVGQNTVYKQEGPYSTFAVYIDQRAPESRAWPDLRGEIQLPAEFTDEHFWQKGMEEKDPPEVALTGGRPESSTDGRDKVVIACYQGQGADAGNSVAMFTSMYSSCWAPLQLPDLATWKALAPNLLQGYKAWGVGRVSRKGTAGLPAPTEFDYAVRVNMIAIPDVPEIVRRAGFKVGSKHVDKFLLDKPTDLRWAKWADCAHKDDFSLKVLNLAAVEGDASKILALVDEGKLECYVVCNHAIEEDELAAARALPEDELVAVLLGEQGAKIKSNYKKREKVFCVYVLGEGARAALLLANRAKRQQQ